MTLVPAQEVKQAWYQMCEKATTKEEVELLTIKLGKAGVLDTEGRPVVLYHGTGDSFDTFRVIEEVF